MKKWIAVALSALAIGLPTASGAAGESGVFSLAPGESREFHIGSTYRNIRVCNDLASAGTLTAWFGHHLPHVLGPGLCADDSGDGIALRNGAAGRVNGTFRSLFGGPGSDGPGGYQWELHF